jgi:hypothetical protein
MEAVASVQLSATTMIRYRALGQLSCCKLAMVFPIPAASSCAGTMTSKKLAWEEGDGDESRPDRQVNISRYMHAAVAGSTTNANATTAMEKIICIGVSR